MQPGLRDAVGIAQGGQHQRQLVAQRTQHAHRRQLGQRAHQRGERHALEQRLPHRRVVQQRRRHRLPRQVVRTDQRRRRRHVRRPGKRGRAPHQGGKRLRLRAAAGPVQQRRPRRVGHLRMGQPQQVAVRPASALAILHQLVGEPLRRLLGVPRPHGPAQRPAPATRALGEGGELEQVRAGPRDAGQRSQGSPARAEILGRGGERQSEQRRIVLRCPPTLADGDDAGHGPCPVGGDGAQHGLGVVTRERGLAGVVAAALGPEHEEAVQPRPVIDREGVPARAVRHGAGDGLVLRVDRRSPARKDGKIALHGPPRVARTGGHGGERSSRRC